MNDDWDELDAQARHDLRCAEGIMISLSIVLALGILLVCAVAFASPPPPDSEQGQLLAPHSEWIRGLTNPTTGEGCCNLSDCRMVQYRASGSSYEAFIDSDTFPGAPNKWMSVPDEVVLHRANPTGFAVACWAAWRRESSGFFCFTPAGGV